MRFPTIKKISSRAGKWLVVLLLLCLLLGLLSQWKPVQDVTIRKAVSWLNKKLDTEVAVEGFAWKRFQWLELKDVLVRDQYADTLLAAKSLSIHFNPLRLLRSEVVVDRIGLSDMVTHIRRDTSGQWNYDFIRRAFAGPAQPQDSSGNARAWQIKPNSLSLQHTRITYQDQIGKVNMIAALDELKARVGRLDLAEQLLEVRNLRLERPLFYYADRSLSGPVDTDVVEVAPPVFPIVSWKIQVVHSKLEEGRFAYEKGSREKRDTVGFDPGNVMADHINWEIGDVLIHDDEISGAIRAFSLQERSGFLLEQLQGEVAWTDTMASIRNFHLQTPSSELRHTSSIAYPTLAALGLLTGKSELYRSEDLAVSIRVEEGRVSMMDLEYFLPGITKRFGTPLISGRGTIRGTLANLRLEDLNLRQGRQLHVRAAGRLRQVLDQDRLNLNLNIEDLAATYAGLAPFVGDSALPTALENWGLVQLQSKVRGDLKNLKLEDLRLTSERGPQLAGNVYTVGLPDLDNTRFQLTLDTLFTVADHWLGFFPGQTPTLLSKLGRMELSGTFDGTIRRFDTNFRLHSEAGFLQTKARFDFNEDHSNAAYDGSLILADFDLGKLGNDSLLGKANLRADITGEGLRPAEWNTKLNAHLSDLTYRNYAYDSLELTGNLQPHVFTGNIRMDDPNLRFRYQGRVPIQDSMPVYQFDLQLETLNLQPLGLSRRSIETGLDLHTDIENFQVDELEGQLILSNVFIRDSIRTYRTDSIVVVAAKDVTGHQSLNLGSDLLQFDLQGKYQLSGLANEMLAWASQYFPFGDLLARPDSLQWSDRTDLRAHLNLENPKQLTRIIAPNLRVLDGLDIDLAFQPAKGIATFQLGLPTLRYATLALDSLEIRSRPVNAGLTVEAKARQLQSGENVVLPRPGFKSVVRNDTLSFDFSSTEQTDRLLGRIAGSWITEEDYWRIELEPFMRINGVDWQIDRGHRMKYHLQEGWQIRGLDVNKGREFVRIDGVSGTDTARDSLLALQFDQFDIAVLNPLMDLPNNYLGGALNGRLEARDFLSNLNFTADLSLLDWRMDTTVIGNLQLLARQSPAQPLIVFSSALTGQGNHLGLEGTYAIDDRYFDLKAQLERLTMSTLDPFLSGLVHNSQGYLDGRFSVKGEPGQPVLNGRMQLHEVQTTVDYINIPYRVAEATIDITDREIRFGKLEMTDAEGRSAALRGKIDHQFFDDITLDLNFATNRFQFLNTTAENNELFYGQLFLKSDMTIRGPADQPRFFINAVTQPGTRFYTVPLTEEEAITQEDFIIFGRPGLDSLGRDTNYLNNYRLTSPGVDLQLNLEMTKDAELQVIIDPLSGDKLVCKGVSNLTVDMDPAQNVRINGSYELTEGRYSFSYEQLIKRDFTILPGSKISFNGDPLRAQLDITAAYQTRVVLGDLVRDQMTDGTSSASIQRADVQVQMKISGDLAEPVLTFDIVLLGNPQGSIANAAQNRLRQLRNNETELNTQVFGLLLFNSFIDAQNSGQTVTNAGEAALLSSVSKLVSNQLNRLAGKLIKGLDLSLGVEAYRPGIDPASTDLATEVQLGVSKRLFNDRLNVKVGGNLDIGTGSSGEQEGLTAFTGDFVLEYRLSPSGNYLLRVYRRSNYDALNEGNVSRSGAGVSIRKTFKNKIKKRKR